MGTNTTILGLYKPDIDEVGWGALRNASYDTLDVTLGTQHGLTGQHKFVTVDSGTGYITFPSLTTVQRDALPATVGMTIYNTTTNTLQSYQAGTWQDVITSSLVVEDQNFSPSVSAVNTIRFPDGTVTDLGSGVVSIAGFVQDSEGVVVGDVLYFDGGNWSRIAPGSAGQVFQTNGAGVAPTWVDPTSGGNVSAALSLTDNRIVRGDGGSTGIQTSGITIDDSDNVTGIVNITTTGTVTHNGVTYTFPAVDGANGQFLQTNGAGVLAWATPAGSGNVSTTTIADNTLVRGDGGAQDIQDSGITIDDSDNMSGVANFTNTGTVTHNGVTYTFPAADGAAGEQLTTNGAGVLSWDAAGSGGGVSALTTSVNQVGHGFSVGNWLYHTGAGYALADASVLSTVETTVGVVSSVEGVDDFTITTAGYVTGLSGLTAGSFYYVSETAGAITSTEPTGSGVISKGVLVADTTTSGIVLNHGVEQYTLKASAGDTPGFLDSKVDGTSITVTANDLTVVESGVDHDALQNFVANEHVDHTSVTLTAGVGLSGGGDISANRTFDVNVNELTDTVITASDEILFGDVSDSNNVKKDTVQGILDLAGGGSMEFIQSGSASSATSFTVTQTVGATETYFLVVDMVIVSGGNNIVPAMRINGSSSAVYDWTLDGSDGSSAFFDGASADTEINLLDSTSPTDLASGAFRMNVWISSLNSDTQVIYELYSDPTAGGNIIRSNGAGRFRTAAMTSLTILRLSGDETFTGNWYLFRLNKS